MARPIVSAENQLRRQDIERVARNALIFAAPLIILALTELQRGTELRVVVGIVAGAGVQVLIDLLRKFLNENKYLS